MKTIVIARDPIKKETKMILVNAEEIRVYNEKGFYLTSDKDYLEIKEGDEE